MFIPIVIAFAFRGVSDNVVNESAGEQPVTVDPEQKNEEVPADKSPAAEGVSQ